ncbi:MAG: hypothetical protein QM784_37725 [Polyangiaceae bacterium]
MLYDHFASKERLSRLMLSDVGWSKEQLSRIPEGEAFRRLVEHLGQPEGSVTNALLATHDVGRIWWIMGGIGLLSAAGIHWYARRWRAGTGASRTQ